MLHLSASWDPEMAVRLFYHCIGLLPRQDSLWNSGYLCSSWVLAVNLVPVKHSQIALLGPEGLPIRWNSANRDKELALSPRPSR
jgi:hypothetical protein